MTIDQQFIVLLLKNTYVTEQVLTTGPLKMKH
jgi:hypothetical protein